MIVSLERALSKLGYCSRKHAAKLIEAGKVSVDGRIITTPNKRVSLESEIKIDGEQLTEKKTVWIMLNKPKNFLNTL